MMVNDLKGKVCVITGGGGVLGAAMAKGLAKQGVYTVIMDRNACVADALSDEITKEFGVKSISVCADVLDKESLEKAKEFILSKFPSVDFLINGAGGNSPKATTKTEQILPGSLLEEGFFGLDLQGFQDVFSLNYTGTILPTMVFARDMVKNGKGVILNISSMNSFRPLTKIPAYSSAKSAINNLTQWLAVHFGRTGVRVNAVAPGFFLTNQNRFLLTDEKTGELTPRGQKIISSTPTARFGNPEDLVGTVCFLLSDMSAFVTGVVVPVDGGYSAFGGV